KATKPQTVQIVRQGEVTPDRFKFNLLYLGSDWVSDGIHSGFHRLIPSERRF
ncbi:TPA: hypothetical protein ACFKVH_07055, partial [Neisseria gonorrhoeae]